jgi:secreted PhoX family phosphatase
VTPWGAWLSCEEVDDGLVYECDPTGVAAAVAHPAMGRFKHEAAAVDPVQQVVYLTEDVAGGGFYRFVPDLYPDLSSGRLEVAEVLAGGAEGAVVWHEVPDPSGVSTPTRQQVAAMTEFDGGEGIDYHDGRIYFATKGDSRVWCYDTVTEDLSIRYDGDSILQGVDNLVVGPGGDILVGEDGDDMQIVALTPAGSILPVIQLVGQNSSEITGPAFDPGGTRLYFSSQRGTTGDGITFEVSGPFVV